jgi:hypothetical protein
MYGGINIRLPPRWASSSIGISLVLSILYNWYMKLMNKLENKFGNYIPSNLTYYLIIGQFLAFLTIYSRPTYATFFILQGNLLYHGEWWRMVTFLFAPVSYSIIFVVLVWYMYYVFGSALERQWGSFRYFAYMVILYVATILAALLFPDISLTNAYLFASIFLAFAYLNPDYMLYIFFILPVKIKWLAALLWIGIIAGVLFGDIPTKVLSLLSVSNFLLFFGRNIWLTARYHSIKASLRSSEVLKTKEPNHICAVCGKNERDNPAMDIRYCSQCIPQTCYCEDHIQKHTHKKRVD